MKIMNGMGKLPIWRLLTTIGLMLLLALIPVACGSKQTNSTPTPSPAPTHVAPTSVPAGTTFYTFRGHAHNVNVAVWSPDGKQIASGDVDGIIRVWDAKTGKTNLVYKRHTSYIYAIAWSPDGKYIASGGAYSNPQVWDAKTGKLLFIHKGKAADAFGTNAIA